MNIYYFFLFYGILHFANNNHKMIQKSRNHLPCEKQSKIALQYLEEKEFTITGKINGAIDGALFYLIKANGNEPDTVSRVKSIRGTFIFREKLQNKARFYWIKLENQNKYITLFLDGSNVIIEGEFTEWPRVKTTGSATNDEYMAYLKQLESNIGFKDIFKITYISNHPNSFYTPVLIRSSTLNLEEKMKAYDKLTDEVKKSFYGNLLYQDLNKKFYLSTIGIGNVLPDFKSNTPNGDTLSVYQFLNRNKITLIDFWASWCVPCRKEIPNLKKVYEAFRSKGFGILSISFDFNKNNWLKAIEKDSMTWHNLSQLKGREEDAGKLFGINGIPAAILVNSDGKIISIDAPFAIIKSCGPHLRGDNLYTLIDSLLLN